ncbi:helix-turn-helix domain-containing protein [Nocardia sp. NPDC055049]
MGSPDEDAREFHGQRLTALREVFGLTQTALAERIEVSQSFLSQVERGARPVPDSLVVAASSEFGLPVSFFSVPTTPLDVTQATFRKTARAGAKDEQRLLRLYNEAARLFRTVSEQSGYIEASLPEPADYDHDPEAIARAMRRRAGLDDEAPVLNATRCLERFGFGVIDRLDEHGHGGRGHTGISRPSRLTNRPLVALVEDVPGAVKRLTILHEAYHWIADRDRCSPIASTRSPEEHHAFQFAAAFLLPEEVVRRRVSESLNLHGYLPIKADYGISVGAITRRARDLSVISSQRYRSLAIQLSSQGWRTDEPVEVADEKPLLVSQALSQVYGSQPNARASHVLGLAPAWIHRWTRGGAHEATETAGAVIDFAAARRHGARREHASLGRIRY